MPLPLGSVRASGWLLTQLQLQRDGLTGHAERVIPNLDDKSGWLGGTGPDAESWEKGPYYVKGLVSLAYVLDDPELKQTAQKWIDWSLSSQKPDGSFGPTTQREDWWPRMVMTFALRQYAEATDDPRVLPFLQNYLHYMLRELPSRPLREWSKARAGDQIDTVYWVYNRTGDPDLLKLAKLLHDQAYDWTSIYTGHRYFDFGDDMMPKHCVNVSQALKMPAVWYQHSRDPLDRDAFRVAMDHLLRSITLPLAVPTGTEVLSGRSAIQAVELCTVVEQMFSDETVIRILNDPAISDMLERTAFNALPGAMTKDLKAYQYYTSTNNAVAVNGGHGFNQDHADSMVPGPVSGFPCCCYNLHMGWPMLVQHAWMATADGGLAAVIYAPSTVRANLPAAGEVTIAEETDYPFRGKVRMTISLARPASFPIQLRVPGWCLDPSCVVNGKIFPTSQPGTTFTLDRQWCDGDIIDLTFPMPLVAIPTVNNSISLARGPLVFSLRLTQEAKVLEQDSGGFRTVEMTSPDSWNLGLEIDPTNPAASVKVCEHPMPTGNPFQPDLTPVTLTAAARSVPSWKMDWTGHSVEDPPVSPLMSGEPSKEITLVPFGAQTLRITAFPWLGQTRAVSSDYSCDFRDPQRTDWIDYGGSWYVKQGSLRPAGNGRGNSYGIVGVKTIASNTHFADLDFEADVTPGTSGDAGLLFRVSHPAIGANAFDGYYAGVDATRGLVILGRAEASSNTWLELGRTHVQVQPGEAVRLRVTARGPILTIYLGRSTQATLEVSDSRFASGAIGVREYSKAPMEQHAIFANIQARRVISG
jgi:hypothetical protein